MRLGPGEQSHCVCRHPGELHRILTRKAAEIGIERNEVQMQRYTQEEECSGMIGSRLAQLSKQCLQAKEQCRAVAAGQEKVTSLQTSF